MNILFTVCARAGSKGFKNKNLKIFLGYPLLYHTLAAIEGYSKKYGMQHHIDTCISSDSPALLDLSSRQDRIPLQLIMRSPKLSGDNVAKMEVIRDCLLQTEARTGICYDMVVDLDLTSPLRTVKDVQNAIAEKQNRPDTDVIFSVVPSRRNPYFNMVIGDGAYFRSVLASNFTARQQAPAVYDMNASIYAYAPHFLKAEPLGLLLEGKCGVIQMRDTAVLDIDGEEDFLLMEAIASYLLPTWEGYAEIYERIKQFDGTAC